MSADVRRLYGDPYIKKKRGICEFILGGLQDTKLLEVRVFDDATKHTVYEKQTSAAKAKKKSNCPLCAVGNDANKSRSMISTKWTPTTLQHGARAAEARPTTAKCSALPTIEPKVIDNSGPHAARTFNFSSDQSFTITAPVSPYM
jgi:hypothetical protein